MTKKKIANSYRKVRASHHRRNLRRWYKVSAPNDPLFIFTRTVGRAKSCYFKQLEMERGDFPDIRVRLARQSDLQQEIANKLQNSFIDNQ